MSATSITWSSYLNSYTNDTIKSFIVNDMQLSWDLGRPFSSYLDLPALALTLLMFMIALIGIKFASLFNNVLAFINVSLLILITIAGFVYGDVENLSKAPYNNGFGGIIKV